MLALAAVVLALASGGCGGSAEPDTGSPRLSAEEVLAAVEGLDRKARLDRLRSLAEKEGNRLDLYGPLPSDVSDPVIDAFEEAFDIDVAYYRASGETVTARILEEHAAGYSGADVALINGLALTNLADEGILADYRSPVQRDLAEGAVADRWTAYQMAPFVLAWNTELVSEAERPRSWEDLADPRWRGQVGIEASDFDWFQRLREDWIAGGKSAEEADRLFRQIGRNAVVMRGHSFMGQLQAAGELALSVNYLSTVKRIIADGGPLAWQPAVEPVVVQPNGVGVLASAKHPAAAVLFVDWLLSDGQALLAELGREPTRRDLVVTGKIRSVVIDFDRLAPEQKRWAAAFERLLAAGRAGPEQDSSR